ncbi:hypothetical protein AAHA92_06327 [Salvia divinorum]|uniref:Uncharacterized protein n=1 Tax=Salvia divinorum TaxID=28513 RepID=A0ABD1I7L4_SALDI
MMAARPRRTTRRALEEKAEGGGCVRQKRRDIREAAMEIWDVGGASLVTPATASIAESQRRRCCNRERKVEQ